MEAKREVEMRDWRSEERRKREGKAEMGFEIGHLGNCRERKLEVAIAEEERDRRKRESLSAGR